MATTKEITVLPIAEVPNDSLFVPLPNSTLCQLVGRPSDESTRPFLKASCVLHRKRVARIPTAIPENSQFLAQLTVETNQWKLGSNNPYLALRDEVDHTDAILDEIESRRAEHSKRDFVKSVFPLQDKKKYKRARKPHFIPNCGASSSSYPTRHYEPQMGNPLSSAVEKLKQLSIVQHLPLPDDLLSRFEDLVLFFLQIKEAQSEVQFVAILIAYYKTFVSGSILRAVEAFVHSLFADSFVEQSGEPSDPKWLSYLREGKTNWNTLINCSAFERVSKLLSLCVTLGMCEASNLTFSIGRYKLFSVEAQKKHVTSLDLLDAFANTVFYFVEGGYRVFTSGSLAPLIYSDFEAKQFDDDCNLCDRLAEFAKTGDIERLGNTTTHEFDNLLVNTIDKGHQLLNSSQLVSEKAVFRSRVDRLRRVQTELIQTRLSSGLREAPFVISFYGGSAQGKSSIAKIFMTALLEANGFQSDPEYICTVSENDKYHSTYRSCVNGVYVDDIGNAKADFVDRPPSQILIDLNNNVPTYALQAEADKKGKVVVEPKIVVCTSNVKDLGGTVYSNEPVSIARRADIHITTSVKEEYATNGMLDSTKVWKAFPDGDLPIQDIWDLTVEVVKAVPSSSHGGKDSIGWVLLELNGEKLSNVGVEKALRCVVEQSRQHFINQKRLVTQSNTLRERMQVCVTCGMPAMYCKCRAYGPFFPGLPYASDLMCTCTGSVVCANCTKYSELEQYCTLCDKIKPTQTMVSDSAYGEYLAVNHYCHCFGVPRQHGELVYTSETLPEKRVYTEQFGELLAGAVLQYSTKWLFKSRRKVLSLETRLEEYATAQLFQIANTLENSWVSQWTNWIPQSFLRQEWCERVVCYMERDSILAYAHAQLLNVFMVLVCGVVLHLWDRPIPITLPPLVGGLWHYRNRLPGFVHLPILWFSVGAPFLSIPTSLTYSAVSSLVLAGFLLDIPWWHFSREFVFCCAFFSCAFYLNNFLACKKNVYDEIVRRNDAIPSMVAHTRESHVKVLLKYCAIAGAVYSIFKVWSLLRVIPEEQGNLAPDDPSDIVKRDAEQNPWAIPVSKPLPCTLKSKSVTHSTLCELVFNNLAFMSCTIDGKKSSCDAFFPFSNVAIIPQHAWKIPELEMTFVRKDPTSVGANFTCFLSQSQSVHIPNTDFCLVWVPNGGDWKDLRPYFPTGKISQAFATLVYKDKLGKRVDGPMTALYGKLSTGACKNFFGCSYVLPFKTFRGLCMAPIVSQTKGPMIAGFHVGGVEDTAQGCAGFITIQELDLAIQQLTQQNSVLLTKSSGTVSPLLYDVQWFQSDAIHPKSPLNFLPPGTNCEIYGSCIGRAKYYSEVVPLPISSAVTEIMGVPPLWGKPKFSTAAWRESLLYSCNPAKGIEPILLDKAYCDYANQIDTILLDPRWKSLVEDTKPLTQMQTVCGIDGKRFIDKMPANTSVGFPLSGPKSQYLELLDPVDFPTQSCPAVLDSRFWDEWMECERKYLDGQRAYPVFKACLKDEPTKLDKDKVRVFQASPIALQLGVRKYFLPLARILSLFPLVSECAVGINAQGPEWHQLMTHIGKYGDNNTLAGDYSKYDLRMPAQLVLVAFRFLIHMAQRCGYTEYDIIIMTGIATDICYPLMAYNGDLIQHYGSNPSGQNLTVYINCIVNSLLFRCGAISILGPKYTRFSEICALVTYGDDADSTVHADFPEFNHLSYAAFLDARGMKFTMPDKSSTPTPYMSRAASHFLKRESKLLGDTKCLCGALEELSIFKSLHSVLRSSAVTTAEQSISNINGAAREFFFHGPDIYEHRRQQLIAVAERHNFLPLCPDLQLTFEDRLTKWKEQYAQDLKCL